MSIENFVEKQSARARELQTEIAAIQKANGDKPSLGKTMRQRAELKAINEAVRRAVSNGAVSPLEIYRGAK